MHRTKCFWVVIIILICIGAVLLAACVFPRKPSETNVYEVADKVISALDRDYQLQTITQPIEYVYADENGNTIVYFLCVTVYCEIDPPDTPELNHDAISAVFDPDTAQETQECFVSGCPAAFFHTGGFSYLCWTMTPKISCILQYDPSFVSEADIRRMAESVPLVTD